ANSVFRHFARTYNYFLQQFRTFKNASFRKYSQVFARFCFIYFFVSCFLFLVLFLLIYFILALCENLRRLLNCKTRTRNGDLGLGLFFYLVCLHFCFLFVFFFFYFRTLQEKTA